MKNHKGFILFFSFLLGASSAVNAEQNFWEDVKPLAAKAVNQTEVFEPTHQKARMLILNEQAMQMALSSTSSINQMAAKSFDDNAESSTAYKKITLPLADGSSLTISITPESLLPALLSEKFPEIKTYRVIPDEMISSGRIDLSQNGFHAMIQTRQGDTFFIDPTGSLDKVTYKRSYTSYRKQDQIQDAKNTFSCGAKASSKLHFSEQDSPELAQKSSDAERSLLTYKIAIAATGEYTAKHGGTVASALAAIVTTLNRVNQVYEHDLGIHLSLVENNDQIIYTNAESDPYTTKNLTELLTLNRGNINSVIGVDNYDIGHLFTTSGGGLAAIAGVCSEFRKAQGISGISNPVNDSFNLDFVAHEIGHQLGATHTFNGEAGLCSGGTRAGDTAFEPGSGSTIMSYAGYCGVDNLQSSTDAMFHIGSINQIRDFTTNNRGQQCGSRAQAANTPPQVNAGKNYIIPAQTPFLLSGTASDSDNDLLVYAWEQIDTGERSSTLDDTGDNALFRVHMPSNSRTRSFPPVQNILNHVMKKGELLPTQQRILKFSFVAQDSFNAAQNDDMAIQVLRTGTRFALNLPHASYLRGDTHKILWNTADTEQHPINCDSVNIELSSNGGHQFDQTLAQDVPNTGEAWITIPAESPLTSQGRFKITCSNNIFFAISFRNFVIGDENIAPFDDEDQPEPFLEDKVINNDPEPEEEQKVASGGGSFDYLLLILLLMVVSRRKIIKKMSENS